MITLKNNFDKTNLPDNWIDSTTKKDKTSFPIEEVKQACQQWMKKFFKDFEPSEVKKYKIEQLYQEDVEHSQEKRKAMQAAYKTLWSEKKGLMDVWKGVPPKGWTKHSGTYYSCMVEDPNRPGYIFKFCSAVSYIGLLSAHFLRVPKGKELQRIVKEENLDELEIVNEHLIALKTQDEIQRLHEAAQSYYFVVKSKKINLLGKAKTISKLSSYTLQRQIKIATQIMQMICKSGLVDVGFDNFNINHETGKLVVIDTKPLRGSLFLDEESKFYGQYQRNDEFMKKYSNSLTVKQGLDNMIKACDQLPGFKKVAQVYRECFLVRVEKS